MKRLRLLRRVRHRSPRLGLCLRNFLVCKKAAFLGGLFVCGREVKFFTTECTEVQRVRLDHLFSAASFLLRLHLLFHGISNVGTLWFEGAGVEFWHRNVWWGERVL